MPRIPFIEVIFVVFLMAFLINYYLIRESEISPYIEDENDNFVTKITGLTSFAGIILLIYAFERCRDIPTALYSFAYAWVF